MQNLLKYISSRNTLTQKEINLVKECFKEEEIPAHTQLLKAGKTQRFVTFLSKGIVKGYENIDGKIVVQHLVSDHEFFTSLDSFMSQTPSQDNFETITDCKLVKISKPDFDFLQKNTNFWNSFVKNVTNEHLSCKLQRIKDFQILSAKERYVKFIHEQPKLALHVSIDNIASFLGMEPQSLSRIRKQIII